MRDDTKHATVVEQASRILATSEADVGTHISEKGSRHRCILEQRSGYSRYRTSENWFEHKLVFEKTLRRRRWCPAKSPAVPFSLSKSDRHAMNQMKEAFEIPKAPYHSTSPISTRGGTFGPNLWQRHHKARDALRIATKGDRCFTSIWDGWQKDKIYRKSRLLHNWSDAWVGYLDHIVHFSI